MQKNEKHNTPYQNLAFRLISDRKFRWLRHVSFLTIGILLGFKGDFEGGEHYGSREAFHVMLIVDVGQFVFLLIMIYLLALVLIPKLLFRGKWFWFLVAVFIMIFLIFVVVWLLDAYLIVPAKIPNLYHMRWTFLSFIQIGAMSAVLLGAVTGIMVFKKWVTDVQRMAELHEGNLKAELEQLKSQVNPHFLFNTLNNLLVLIKTDVDKASQVLLGLSDLLRYQLYDSAKETILLSKDIEFIRNLLELEKIRKNDFTYTIDIVGTPNGLRLPPFLFIPFVENAIKHGASSIGHSFLAIKFEISGDKLIFTSENSKPPVQKKMIGGLGLANIKRRLQLLFPDQHQLTISDTEDRYYVNLNITL